VLDELEQSGCQSVVLREIAVRPRASRSSRARAWLQAMLN
jgi:hypothetical protein